MNRFTISLSEKDSDILMNYGENPSDAVRTLILDQSYAKLYAGLEMKPEEKEYLECELAKETFKVCRLFESENNQEVVHMLAAIIVYKEVPFTKDLGLLCVEQFLKNNLWYLMYYRNSVFFTKCLCERVLQNYLDENDMVQLKEYHSYIPEANRIALKVRKEEVLEAFVYKDNEWIDFCCGNGMRVSAFKKKVESMTGAEWMITDKEAGNTDCTLVRR